MQLTPPGNGHRSGNSTLKNFDSPIIRILLFAVVVSAIVAIPEGSGLFDTLAILAAHPLATGISFFNDNRSSRDFKSSTNGATIWRSG